MKGLWFWEVIWKDCDNRAHSLFSLEGWNTMGEAFTVWQSESERITTRLKELGAVLVLDEQIVYKSSGQLYTDGSIL
jgi:hypothetical protein